MTGPNPEFEAEVDATAKGLRIVAVTLVAKLGAGSWIRLGQEVPIRNPPSDPVALLC